MSRLERIKKNTSQALETLKAVKAILARMEDKQKKAHHQVVAANAVREVMGNQVGSA